MKMKNYTKLSTSLNALFLALLYAVIGMIALYAPSCRTAKASAVQEARQSRTDSLVLETRQVKALPVAEEKARLAIPAKSLLDLPAGASFTERNGRASLSVSRNASGDSIRITAACDSLQALVEYYERLAYRIRGDTMSAAIETKKESATGLQSPLKLLLAGFLAGIITTVIITIKIKK
jgi:hypothetical protein